VDQTGGGTLRAWAAECGLHIGTSAQVARLADSSPYAALVGREFSGVTPEDALKWWWLRRSPGQWKWDGADAVVEFAGEHAQQVRGHTLVWHQDNPTWLTEEARPAAELDGFLREHVARVMSRYAGRIECWDVVNEPLTGAGTPRENVWSRALGHDYAAKALTWARAVDPAARLYINEFGAEGFCPKSDALYRLVRELLERGVALDGVGFQAHLMLGGVPDRLSENLQRFADLGLDVAVTELDVSMELPATAEKLDRQAADYRAVLESCLAVDRFRGLTVWGATDADSWMPRHFPGRGAGLLFDEEYRAKPAYFALADALRAHRTPRSAPDAGPTQAHHPTEDPWPYRPTPPRTRNSTTTSASSIP
jgi:endo-1,4-beta-xylanase